MNNTLYDRLNTLPGVGVFAVLILLVLLSYGNALLGQFVWDDGYLIVENPYIKDWRLIPHLFRGDLVESTSVRHYQSGYYRPVSMLSFMADYHFWGLNPAGFHLTNLVFHLAACWLVFCLVERLCSHRLTGFLAAMLFAVHPIHVEAVTPIYNRMGVQVTVLMLAAMVFWLDYLRRPRCTAGLAVTVLAALALLSKENALVLLPVLMALDYFSTGCSIRKMLSDKYKMAWYTGLLAVAIGYLALRQANVGRDVMSLGMAQGPGHVLAPTAGLHLLTVSKIFGLYVVKLVVPYPLNPVYWTDPVLRALTPQAWAGAVMFAVILYSAWRFRKSAPVVSFFLVLFLVSVLPYTNLMPFRKSYAVQERFLYFPSVAACGLVAMAAVRLLRRFQYRWVASLLTSLAVCALLSVCVGGVAYHNFFWLNNLMLWQRAAALNPDSQLAHLNLSYAYLNESKLTEAEAALERSLNVRQPKSGTSLYIARLNLANIALQKNALKQAEDQLNAALRTARSFNINPFAAYDKLGLVAARREDAAAAEHYFQKALKYNENFPGTLYNLGVLYATQGQHDKAGELFSRALAFDQDFAAAAYALGQSLAARGKIEEAKEVYEKILRRNPGDTYARGLLNSLNTKRE